LILIEHERHWRQWQAQVAHLRQRGLAADMLDRQALSTAEPLLRVEKFLGAAWCREGHLNPHKLALGFARAARRGGAKLRPQSPVVEFTRRGSKISGVRTAAGDEFSAGVVLVAAGAWSGQLLRLAGVELPVQFTHAEAFITEPLPPLLRHHIGLADFYDTIHNRRQAVSVGLAQQQAGTLLVTEAVAQTGQLHRRNSAWGIPAVARDLLALFPALSGVRVMRGWAAPSPFLPDEQPAIGWAPGLDNLFIATCFHLTITTIPVLSQMMAAMILGQPVEPSLAEFSPARFASAQHQTEQQRE